MTPPPPATLSGAVPLVQDYLTRAARHFPDKVALVAAKRRHTYGELDRASTALAGALARRGVRRGDRVIVFADNTVETYVAFWGVLKASAVVSLVSPMTKEDKLAYYLNDCRASALLSDAHLQTVFVPAARRSRYLKTVIVSGSFEPARLAPCPNPVRWEDALAEAPPRTPGHPCIDIDLAAIVYTSGSTGDPKGVMLTHRNMLAAADSIGTYLQLDNDEVILSALPMAFDYGLYQAILSARAGARLVLERSFSFPAAVLRLAAEERATCLPGVPTMFAVLSDMKNFADYDLPAIRCVTNTAAALPEKHIRMLRRLFPTARIYSMYGLTECKRCTYLPPEYIDAKPASVGVAIPNTEIWLVDDSGRKLDPGQVGQLVVRGATVMKGYWEKPDETAKMLRPGPLPGEQVLYTGDLCRMDDDGFLYFVGRADDIIKSRGEKVAPKEVETVLCAIDGVREAAVVGVADALLGQAVVAYVVLSEGVRKTEQELRHACAARLENFMVPKQVVFVESLPRTPTGKIDKRALP